jgi:hypothetical protein
VRSFVNRASAIAATVALSLSMAACGGDDTADTTGTTSIVQPTEPADPPPTDAPSMTAPSTTEAPVTQPPETDPSPTTAPAADLLPVAVYFALDERAAPVRRFVDPMSTGLLAGTFEAWLEGPTPHEQAAGYGTMVPAGTRLLNASYEDDLVVVDLSGEFASGGGSAAVIFRLAELVMTAYSAVIIPDGVVLMIDGQVVEMFTGEGIVIDGPLTMDDVEAQLPAIVQHSVLADDEVSEGVQIAGWANVFEATVSVQVLDAGGALIHDSFTTATCGTGCRGNFVTWLTFDGYTGPATLRLFEVSSKDGSDTNVVEFPITVVPAA